MEKERSLGGNALRLNRSPEGVDLPAAVQALAERAIRHPLLTVHAPAQALRRQGLAGAFSVTLEDQTLLRVGAVIVATGGEEFRGAVYGLGSEERVVTLLELGQRLGREPRLPARLGQEALYILAPREPYVCIGYHQDLEQEVDLAYCRQRDLPVFRREVGGGAVFLDGRQIFFQLVLSRQNPLAQGGKAAVFRRLLEPVAAAYNDLGVPARYRPVNDLITAEGRKISGTGAAESGDCLVLVGNLIADFDYDTMVRVLRVPDQKYRDKVFQSMRENLSTLRRETGRDFPWAEMAGPLARRFAEVLGPLEAAEVPAAVRAEALRLAPGFLVEEWLFKKGRRLSAGRDVRIAGEVNVLQRVHKAPGGFLRATLVLKAGLLEQVSLSGDFFCYPLDALERLEGRLTGAPLEKAAELLEAFYAGGVEFPGVAVADWLEVLGAKGRG